jgi:RNA polymerase sigma factor, sigma-70 family
MSEQFFRSAQDRRKLLAYIARRDRNPASSEDVLQETLLRLLEQSRKQAILDPMAYAYRIADTVIYARARQKKRETELGDMDFAADVPAGEQVLEYKQRAALFRDALLAMSPVRRSVFVKRHLEGKARSEIAAETGLSLEAVKKHLLRAMAELAALNDTLDGPASLFAAAVKGSPDEE